MADPYYPVIVATDATALEGGKVYIGMPYADPEASPMPVYWDAALTVPAAQPLRTSGGMIVRDGSPTNFYAAQQTYSVRVRDRLGAVVWYKAQAGGTEATRLSFPIATGPQGGDGPSGPASSTFASLALLKAAPASNRSYILADPTRAAVPYSYVAGDFTGKADDSYIVALNGTPLSQGALIRGRDRDTLIVEDFSRFKNGNDWGPAIQAAMNQLAASGGGTLRFARRGLANAYYTSNLFWRERVYLDGGARGAEQSEGAWLRPLNLGTDTFLIDRDSSSGDGAYGAYGLSMYGDGASGTTGGMRSLNANQVAIVWCNLSSWSRNALIINGGICSVEHSSLSGWARQTLAGTAQVGTLEMSGADNFCNMNEIAASSGIAISSAHNAGGNIAAARFYNNNVSIVQGNIFEVGDAGCNHWGDSNRYIGNRYDTNAGYGLLLQGTGNVSIGEYFGRNSFGAGLNNQYDHIYAPVGQSGRNSIISPNFYSSVRNDGTWVVPRYVINDQTTGEGTENRYIHPGNIIYAPTDEASRPSYGTAYWNLASGAGGGAAVTLANTATMRLGTGSDKTKPSVLNLTNASADTFYTSPTTLADLLDGFPGQEIRLDIGPNVTIADGDHFDLRGKGPITGVSGGRTIRLRKKDKWTLVDTSVLTKISAQPDSTATTIADLRTDFNALLAKARTAGILAT